VCDHNSLNTQFQGGGNDLGSKLFLLLSGFWCLCGIYIINTGLCILQWWI